ncbi:hypothetical protein O181_081233 [Austropuccinia psidii MF-1]|uniref:J domain-containing protein n=1 Tax=Austropuccinia psidii MF-1 TaxID=1389203 RepID=A0A9Q3FK74_9BASI|nr:hypothetical protein [Austropuccinia psidii MF-1]
MKSKNLFLIITLQLINQITCYDSSSSSDQLTTSQLVAKANSLLASGKPNDALQLYEIALERDPDDYLTLYKKATTQMSLGHYNHASTSFQKVLSLKDFDRPKIQLAKIHLIHGDFEACEVQIKLYIDSIKDEPPNDEILKIQHDLKLAKKHTQSAHSHLKSKQFDKCVKEATDAIKLTPQSISLRQLRADCHLMRGHLNEAAGDLTRVALLSPNNPLCGLRVSLLSYFILDQPLDQSIKPVKQCLHSDPESKPCKKAFRQLKSIDKDLNKVKNFIDSNGYRSAIKLLNPKGKESEGLIEKIKEIIKNSQEKDLKSGINEPLMSPSIDQVESHSKLLTKLYSYICKAHIGLNEVENLKKSCQIVYERDSNDKWGLIGKAEILMAGEEWEEAVQLLKELVDEDQNDEEVEKRFRKAQKGLKVSKQKDYYKVLGVPKDADAKTLKKAYRKASLKAHPDKGGSQAKMTALNEAYEVLSNPELRARYDNGDDPNDPTSGHGNPFQGSGHPFFQQFFQQGGSPFGGQSFSGSSGGQTFSFRFG